jgi:hypothetical protein
MKRLSVAAPILMALVMSACGQHPNGLPPGCTPETIQERIAGYEGKSGRGIIVKLSDGHVYRRLGDTTTTTDGIREPFAAGTHVIVCPPKPGTKPEYTIAIEIVGRPYEPFQRLR